VIIKQHKASTFNLYGTLTVNQIKKNQSGQWWIMGRGTGLKPMQYVLSIKGEDLFYRNFCFREKSRTFSFLLQQLSRLEPHLMFSHP